MTGLVRKASLLAAAGVLMASAAFAGVPSAANSTGMPSFIPLVTRNAGGAPDGLLFGTVSGSAGFTITVRDLANNPLNNCSVVLDFGLTTDLQICGDQLDANALVNCAGKTVRKFTDVAGQVTFGPVYGTGKGNAFPGTGLNGGRIFANGVLIASPTVPTADYNGINGIDPFDQAILLGDINQAGTPHGRADMNCSNSITAFDKTIWLTHFNNAQTQSCGALGNCP